MLPVVRGGSNVAGSSLFPSIPFSNRQRHPNSQSFTTHVVTVCFLGLMMLVPNCGNAFLSAASASAVPYASSSSSMHSSLSDAGSPPPGPTSARFYTIHWNSSNPIFRIDRTDNVIVVNRHTMKFEYDQANLICPVYMPGTRDDAMEKHIIYNVSKEEYETCRITNPNPRIIAVCDKPYKLMYFTITFRPFTPQPGGLEFIAGQNYYFISTASKEDLHRRIGGQCASHNMRIVFKVWSEQSASTTSTSIATPPASYWNIPTMPGSGTRFDSWTRLPQVDPDILLGGHVNREDNDLLPTTIATRTTTPVVTKRRNTQRNRKRTKTSSHSKHPNEVVKSEELTLGGGSGAGSQSLFQFASFFRFGILLLANLVVLTVVR